VQTFLHDRLRKLEALLLRSSQVLTKYNQLDLDLAAALSGFLEEGIALHRALQLTRTENALLALQAQFVSAEQGTHPDTLLRSTGHRRELVRSIALRVLQHSAELLRNSTAEDRQRLDEASGQLRPLVLLALRDGMVPLHNSRRVSQRALQRLWTALLQASDSALAARQLAMQCSVYDILLLLGEHVDAATRHPVRDRGRQESGVTSKLGD